MLLLGIKCLCTQLPNYACLSFIFRDKQLLYAAAAADEGPLCERMHITL